MYPLIDRLVSQLSHSLFTGADSDEGNLEVSEQDFDDALRVLVPSVSKEELEKYAQIRASFQS